MAPVDAVSGKDVFVAASSSSEWYTNLKRYGSCLQLLNLLKQQRELIHQVGPEGITVLHKGVDHGCVKLVRFILVDMFDDDGKCNCRRHDADNSQRNVGTPSDIATNVDGKTDEEKSKSSCALTREGLLRKTSAYGSTAVNMAVVSGSPKMVLLLKWAIDKFSPKNWETAEKTAADNETYRYDDYRKLKFEFRRERGNPTAEEAMQVADSDTEVPAVADDGIHEIYETDRESERDLIRTVYNIVEKVLELNWGNYQEEIDILKDGCRKHADFEFVDDTKLSNVFLHYLFSVSFVSGPAHVVLHTFLRRVLEECIACDMETGSMVKMVFSILDPRGRTILHAAFRRETRRNFNLDWLDLFKIWRILERMGKSTEDGGHGMLSSEEVRECMNARDGAGRTILHLMAIHDTVTPTSKERTLININERIPINTMVVKELEDIIHNHLDWSAPVTPFCNEKLTALKKWCLLIPDGIEISNSNPILLAVIFNATVFFQFINWEINPQTKNVLRAPIGTRGIDEGPFLKLRIIRPFQIAAFLGRSIIIDLIFKRKIDITDRGLGIERYEKEDVDFGEGMNVITDFKNLPAIHCAALSNQVETIQTILKHHIYDPLIQDWRIDKNGSLFSNGTALHLLLKKESFEVQLDTFHKLALSHVLPNSKSYSRVKNDFLNLQIDHSIPRMFSANEISCINLLLQGGIDIWTPDERSQEHPSPGPMANDEARKWWFEKVVTEVVAQKASVSSAANATSVVATLVATASFIGPFSPPLSYSGDGGYVHTSLCAVRVYLVCNSFSFFFSIASILMAVLPAIPMPKESLFEELFRSQRCLKFAASLLLISILCLLVAFSSASIAVVSPERHDKQIVVTSIVLGWAICTIVLGIYIIRMFRLLFHKNDRFRRWFAKNMIF